jgi:hypothetical protein
MAFETPHDGKGTYVSWGGYVYTVTNIVISFSDPNATEDKIAVSHLGQTVGETAKTLELPLSGAASGDTGRTVTFDYIGKELIADKTSAVFSVFSGSTSSAFLTKNGTCQSTTLTMATNDAIRGQSVIRIER